ncbi:MAG: T9SS type A sorting domain-containing protein [Phaeodactylibacter sp.]|nr:T9SS type A sorting domain-containing protein [Phaeodactylibacter sp.]
MRRPWFTLLFIVFTGAIAFGQPTNDECGNAIPLPFGAVGACASSGSTFTLTGDNSGATPSTPAFQLADDLGGGPALNGPSADVWYELQPTGSRLDINLEGMDGGPVLILFQGDGCDGLLPIAWAGSAGTANLESPVEPGQRYFLLAGGADAGNQGPFTLTATTFNDCNTCARRRGVLSADPPPVNGFYQAGQQVQFCYRATFWDPGQSLEWLHGVEVQFGPGWDQSTLETVAPQACTAPSGYWQWYDSWQSCNTGETFGPGFAFDAEYGLLCPGARSLDGDPGNNFGDGPCYSVDAGPLPLEFCWTIRASDNFATPQEANLNLEVSLLGDGYSGSWMPFSCEEEAATTFFATALPDSSLLPDITIIKAPCATGCDGIATIAGSAAGSWFYKLSEADGDILYNVLAQPGTDTIFGLCPGVHLFEVSNAGGTIRQAVQLEIEAGLAPEAQAGYVPNCLSGEAIQLVAGVNINSAATTYQWTGPNGFSSSQPSPMVDEPGEYILAVEVEGCSAPLASIQAESGVPEIACEATPNRIVFSWARQPEDTAYVVEVLSGQTGAWLSANSFEVSGMAPGEQASIELTKWGTGYCSMAIGEASCQTLPCPLPMITPDTTICRGQSVRLWVNIPPNTAATWSPASGLSCTSCIAPLASPDVNTVYQVDISYPDGCTATRQVAVYVSSLPESILPDNTMPYCLGEPWEICLPEGNDYLWTSPVGFVTTGNCINFPVTSELLTGTHTVRVRLPNGCEFYDYLYLYGKDCEAGTPPQPGYPTARPGSGPNTGVRAYPNPANSRLRVEMAGSGTKVLQLFRMDGRQMLRLETEEAAVDIPAGQFPPGAYWLEVQAGGERERIRVVIVK